jgi:hypothetical protein
MRNRQERRGGVERQGRGDRLTRLGVALTKRGKEEKIECSKEERQVTTIK